MRSLVCAVLLFTLVSLADFGAARQSQLLRFPASLITVAPLQHSRGGPALGSKIVGVTFAIYRQQEGGTPRWLETQNVTIDASGHYNVSLGSATVARLLPTCSSQQEQR